ncbi:hypothetical protein pb186bvf_004663 [Paramecium bursaria]
MSTQYRVPSNDQYIRELENISQKERVGLFNQPPPLTVGDPFNDQLKSSGKEKGVLVNKRLQKNHEPALFQDPGYISLGDPFKESFKAKQIYDKERELAIKNAQPFKPNDKVKSIKNSEFEHLKEFDDKVFQTRTPTGDVRIQARNFLTNPAKRGLGRTTTGNLFSPIRYIPDPFDRQEEKERQDWIAHRSKFLKGAKGFCSTSQGNRPFTADQEVFDGAGYAIKPKRQAYYKGAPFRPPNANKRGFQGTFEVLQHVEEGGPEPKTKQQFFEKLFKTQSFGNPWKPNSNGTFARPTPSVQQKLRNRRTLNIQVSLNQKISDIQDILDKQYLLDSCQFLNKTQYKRQLYIQIYQYQQMFKQILFIALLAVVLAKVHKAAEDPFVACLKSNCRNQLVGCSSDAQCIPTIKKCANDFKGAAQGEETSKKVVACLQQNDKAWALIQCAAQNCDQRMAEEMFGLETTNLIQQLVMGLN